MARSQGAPRRRRKTTAQPSSEAPQPSATDNLRELPELIKNLSEETNTLIRQEIQLVKAELSEKGKKAGMGAGMFGGAAVMGLLTAGAFTSLLILALALVVAPWLAALIVTVVYAAVAGILALMGRKKVQEATPLVPDQAVDAAKSTKDSLQSAWQKGS